MRSSVLRSDYYGIVLLSGGLDSTTLAYRIEDQWPGYPFLALSIDYGQRHQKELSFAARTAVKLGWDFASIDASFLGGMLPGSALTDPNVAVPRDEYDEKTMALTIVPNRNAIFLSIAYGIAAAHRSRLVAISVHAGDHHLYPDCRESFLKAFERMEERALQVSRTELSIYAPFVTLTKAQIVIQGDTLGVPFEDTWSCYEGGELHCGQCGTCRERRQAFEKAGVSDPTVYVA